MIFTSGITRNYVRKKVALSPEGIGFNGKPIAYQSDEVLRVRLLRRTTRKGKQIRSLELFLDRPDRGIERYFVWHRHTIRFRLP